MTRHTFAWSRPLAVAAGAVLLISCDDVQPTAPIDPPVLDMALDGPPNSAVPAGAPATFTDGGNGGGAGGGAAGQFAMALAGQGTFRIYKTYDAWSMNGGRDEATLVTMGLVKGQDFFVHHTSALAAGIPSGTAVVLMTANSSGDPVTSAHQSSPAAQAALVDFLGRGGVVLIDLADNQTNGGYRAPGSTGTPEYVFPVTCMDATLAPGALGPDGLLGTADDHPWVRGPDGVPGTADDLDNDAIDLVSGYCSVVHGNLAVGFTLPPDARVLATSTFSDGPKPVMAEYCYSNGLVIVNTFTHGFSGHKPANVVFSQPDVSYNQRNLFSYALSPASACNSPPVSVPGGPYAGAEGAAVSFDGAASTDPDGDPLSYAWNFGDGSTGSGPNPTHVYADDGSYTVTLTVTDPSGASHTSTTSATIVNVAPSFTSIDAPADPRMINSSVAVVFAFKDPGALDTHGVRIDWGDGTETVVNVGAATSPLTRNHSYQTPGVYRVRAIVTDDDGATGESLFEYIVVYDPSAGFVTGGGWINSPAGAYVAEPTLNGRASFGFVSRYQKGRTTPSGETQFQFHAGNLNFHSNVYEWLVVAGARAQFKGTGSINGSGDYGFLLTVTDGQLNGGGGTDRFRIKIWDRTTGGVIYDNQLGAADDANATMALGGGSIVIHSK